MIKKVSCLVIALELLAAIIIPLICFNTEQNVISEGENRYLASFPALLNDEGKLSKSFGNDFKLWFEDNIGLREKMIKLSSILSFNLFNQPASKDVELGRDGWLFFTDGDNMTIAQGTYPNFGQEQMSEFLRQQLAVRDKLLEQGIEYLLILPVSKVSIYPETIQSGDYELRTTPADVFADYIEANSDLRVIRLKDCLLEEKSRSDELLYYKTDSHWTDYGSYIGYNQIIEKLNEFGLIDDEPLKADFIESGAYVGDISRIMGVVSFKGEFFSEDSHKKISLINSKAESVTEGELYDRFISLMETEGVGHGGLMWKNDSLPHGRNVLIYGDSMIGTCNAAYLAEHFSDLSFVWSYRIEQDMIDLIKPDLIIADVSERAMNKVLPGLHDDFLGETAA